ncbi:hypothetical protein MMC30_004348 [Trapelia coarctata]|nr:hypothetical protein [Trapelia coarctata]
MPSGRRDITIFATVIFVIILLLSFRSIFTDNTPWRGPAPAAPTSGSGNPKSQPTGQPEVPPNKEEENGKPVEVKTTSSTTSTSSIQAPSATSAEPLGVIGSCEGFPDTKDILVVMKTGATEAYDKLPIHFLTTLSCNNDSILFSDMDMNVAGHHVIDSLDEIADEIMKDNSDFDLYKQLQEYHDLHEDPRPLKLGSNGWNLDKYKFIHMLLKTYKYRPDVPWYVFIEADTALIWDNLRTFLDENKSTEPLYIGSPTYLDIEFAHGGTGYIISGAAMKKAVGDHMDIDKKYDKDVHGICCGDAMIGRVLLDEDIRLTKAWPIFNGEKPLTLPFSKSHWCQPVITMHHLTAQEVSQVWNFEKERKANGTTTTLMFMEIFEYFVHPNLNPNRTDWNNLSNDIHYTPPPDNEPDKSYYGRKWSELTDTERASIESPENCLKACEANSECFQWLHHDRECVLHRSVSLGGSQKQAGSSTSWTSGWMIEKIEEFRAEMKNCPDGPDWTVRGI